jgi:hypothetical protein
LKENSPKLENTPRSCRWSSKIREQQTLCANKEAWLIGKRLALFVSEAKFVTLSSAPKCGSSGICAL